MSAAPNFRDLTETMRPQDPHGDGTGLRFETGEHGGGYPDNMPQAITVTDAQGRPLPNFDLWSLGSDVGTPSDCAARCNSVGTMQFPTQRLGCVS